MQHTVNPVSRKVCKVCKRMRGQLSATYEIMEEDSKADSGMSERDSFIDLTVENNQVFHAPVFLSLDFEQLLTGRPTLHIATSVPQDGQSTGYGPHGDVENPSQFVVLCMLVIE